MPEVDEEHVSHKDFASNCSIVADSVITMIDEDFVVLNSGVFRKVMGVFRALHDLYLEKFSDEMSLLVDEIADEVAKSSQRTFTQSKTVTNVKDGGPVPRPQAQSLDSMFTAGAALVTDTMGIDMTKRRVMFPEECLQSVLSIVLALMHLEDHIDSLLRSVAWDVTGLAPKKTRRKASIRGDLSQAVEGTLLEQMQTSLGAESVFWEQQHRLETVTLDPLLQGGKLDNPKVISLMSKDVPVRAGLKQLYIMLSTSVMIRNNVLHYESLLTTEDSGKKLFSPLLRQFSELIDTLMKQIVQLHSQAIATSVLFDAESTDWDNNKDFYEVQ
nr:hypothetical protein BaRGS_006119 [Batillaria attramentaria]